MARVKAAPSATKAPALSHRELRSGPLTVSIEVDAEGNLCGVTLPKAMPAGLDEAALSAMLAQLEKFSLKLGDTPFYRAVWEEMLKIPWGQAMTYGELAAAAGSPRSNRAVGQACAKNPLPLIVPCHRVLADTGLGGFAYGPEWKSKLLELETEPRPRK
jgi:O-6-methylguanine DNA methyltransferase